MENLKIIFDEVFSWVLEFISIIKVYPLREVFVEIVLKIKLINFSWYILIQKFLEDFNNMEDLIHLLDNIFNYRFSFKDIKIR